MDLRGRRELVSKIATLIHQRSGHVEDHEGEAGGCYRAAEEIVGMLPPDLAEARGELERLAVEFDEAKPLWLEQERRRIVRGIRENANAVKNVTRSHWMLLLDVAESIEADAGFWSPEYRAELHRDRAAPSGPGKE